MADVSLDEIIAKRGLNVSEEAFTKTAGKPFQGKPVQQRIQLKKPVPSPKPNHPGIIQLKRAISAPGPGTKTIRPNVPRGAQTPNSGVGRGRPGKGQIDARDMISIKNRIKMGDARAKIIQKRLNQGNLDARAKLRPQIRPPPGARPIGPGLGPQQQFAPQQTGFQPPLRPPRLTGPQRFQPPHQQGLPFQQPRPLFQQQGGPPMNQQRPPRFNPQQGQPFNQQRPPLRQQGPPFNPQQGPPMNQVQGLPFNQQRPPFGQPEPPFNQQGPPFNHQEPPFNPQGPAFNAQEEVPFNSQQPPPFSQSEPVQFNQQPPDFVQEQPGPFGQPPPEFGQEPGPPFGQEPGPPFDQELGPPFGQEQPMQFNQQDPQFVQQGPPNHPFNQQGPPFNRPPQMNQPPPNFNQPPSGPNQPPHNMMEPPPNQMFNASPNVNQPPTEFNQPPPDMSQPPPGFVQPLPDFREPPPGFQPGVEEEDGDDFSFTPAISMVTGGTVVEDTGISLKITRTIPEVSFDGENLTVTRRVPQNQEEVPMDGGPGPHMFTANRPVAPPQKKKFQPTPIKAPSPPRNTVKTGGPILNTNRPRVSSAPSAPTATRTPIQPSISTPGQVRPAPSSSGETNLRFKTVKTVPASAPITKTIHNAPQQPSRLKPPPLASVSVPPSKQHNPSAPPRVQHQAQNAGSALSRIQQPHQQPQNRGSAFSRIQLPPQNTRPVMSREQQPVQISPALSRLSSLGASITKRLAPHPSATPQPVAASQSTTMSRVAVKRPSSMSLSDRFSSGGAGNPIPVITDQAPIKKFRLSDTEEKAADFGDGFHVERQFEGPEEEETGEVTLLSPLQGFRVLVSNLHSTVTQDDVIELFGALGPLKRANLLTRGQAEVAFIHKEHALLALKTYHNRELDGQPMFVKLTTPLNAKVMQAAADDSPPITLPPALRTKKPPTPSSAPVEIPLIHKALFKTATDFLPRLYASPSNSETRNSQHRFDLSAPSPYLQLVME